VNDVNLFKSFTIVCGHESRTRARVKEGGDATSLDGGRRDDRGGPFILILTL